MIHALDVHSVCVRAQLMYWKWHLGTGVKLVKLHQHHVLKIVLGANVVKVPVQQIS